MPRQLSLQLILSLTVIIVIVTGVTGYINIKREETQIIERMIVGAEQLSKSIESATWHSMLADHRQDAYTIMNAIGQEEGIDRIRYYNKEGDITFSTREDDPPHVDIRAEACILCHHSTEPLVKVDTPSRARIYTTEYGQRKLGMITPIYNEPSCSDADCHAHPEEINVLGVLDVSLDLEHVDKEIRDAQMRNSAMIVINVLLISLFVYIFTKRFVDGPIHRLIEGTRAVSNMKLDEPIHIDSSEELGELANSFNIMRERLKEAIQELNSFTQHLEVKVAKRTAQLEMANKKLMATDRLASLGQLAASVAHEINNPLYSILNLSKLMERMIKEDGIPPSRLNEFKKYLMQVSSETARVGHIVTDLLAFSRRSRSQKSEADLNEIVSTTMSLLDHKLNLMNITLDLKLQSDLPHFYCDSSQVQQVIINLVINAAEATHHSEVRNITIRTGYDKSRDSVMLTVEDTGDGMPPELINKIFEPFFTTKTEGKGIGLGLAVVYGIVQTHRGDIDVRSCPGKGTVFSVFFPLKDETEGKGNNGVNTTTSTSG
jgi:two-component system, NtrC family, sensor kinase